MDAQHIVDAVTLDVAIRLGLFVLVGAVAGVIGTLWFGRGYRDRINTLEKEIAALRQQPHVNINVGDGSAVQASVVEKATNFQASNDEVQKTPKELVSMITGLTSIQADQILQPYIGSKQTIRAEVKDVEGRDDCIQVCAHIEDGTTVYFEFNKRSWKGVVERLQRGDEIEATGYLESVAEYGITLERCEL